MGKTKEEIIAITTKNYYETQKQELDSLDALHKHHEAFKKETRASLKQYNDLLKQYNTEETEGLKEFDAQIAIIDQRHVEHHKQIEINKNDSKKQLEKELKLHEKELDKAQKEIDKAIEKIELAHTKQLETLATNLTNDLEKSKKNILDIEEKGVKDEATFAQKITELDTKYNEKLETLNGKETVKIEKLTESSNKKVLSIEEMIEKELAKHDKALGTKKALFEEELAEIDEKIEFEKAEFEKKHQSIKDSVEKRIAVREKHLQRALNDNDKKSAKQHKKDIAKFQKEADNDLVVLEKNYKHQSQTSTDYRVKFIRDYHEDIAKLNEQFASYKEDKQQAIELVKAELVHDITSTKLDYDNLRAKELHEYNEAFAQIREKQETAKMQRQLAVEQENHNQSTFQLEQDKAIALAEQERTEALETRAKERRVHLLQKQKDDTLSQNTYEEALVRLDAEGELADMERQRDLLINNLKRNIFIHQVQHKRHSSIKDEFSSYQQHIGPRFLNRSRDIKMYEDKEVDNRMKLKLEFYDAMKADVAKDYEVIKLKVEETHAEEAKFLEEKIVELAGEKTEELNEFIKSGETKLRTLHSEFQALTESKDRKERKQKEQLYDKETRNYNEEKARRENELNQQVGAYKTLLEDVKQRHAVAIRDLKDAYDQSQQLIQDAMDRIKDNANRELEGAGHLVSTTDAIFQQFNLQAASRTQQQSDAQSTYLNTQVTREETAIKAANESYDRNRNLLNDDMQAKVNLLAQARQEATNKHKSSLEGEEQQLERFRQTHNATLERINADFSTKLGDQNNVFTTKKNDLTAALNQVIGEIKNTLQTQEADFNQTLDTLQKNIQVETTHFETETRRIKKESGERLKETIRLIKADLQQQLQSV